MRLNSIAEKRSVCLRRRQNFTLILVFIFRMENLEKMFHVGLFINDLSMHDSSRDLVLAGTQQQAELKMALAQVTHLRKSFSSVRIAST